MCTRTSSAFLFASRLARSAAIDAAFACGAVKIKKFTETTERAKWHQNRIRNLFGFGAHLRLAILFPLFGLEPFAERASVSEIDFSNIVVDRIPFVLLFLLFDDDFARQLVRN